MTPMPYSSRFHVFSANGKGIVTWVIAMLLSNTASGEKDFGLKLKS